MYRSQSFWQQSGGCEQDKARKQFVKTVKAHTKAQITMNAQDASRYQPEFEEEHPEPKIIELLHVYGNPIIRRDFKVINRIDCDILAREIMLFTSLRNDKTATFLRF